ncbi:MAG: DUF58 domain-containing protein [Planctomycetota bacterium]
MKRLGAITRQFTGGLALPWRMYESLRQSMTVASVMSLLCLLMTFNVIWGFPWSGMMGACVAMLGAGFLINRFMRPSLRLSLSLPRSSVAGQAFSVNARLENKRILPALNLRIGWQREGAREVFRSRIPEAWEASPPVAIEVLRGKDVMHWHGQMRFETRGIHELPNFQVTSSFPFHLFHFRKGIETKTKIAITPAPLSTDHDPTSRVMLAAIGEWAKRLVVGSPVEYVGNREYEVGMPVRRWDFASWARLGRPIVREYQSPSIQSVTLVIDTSMVPEETHSESRADSKRRRRFELFSFERLMSTSATAIAELLHRRVQLTMVISGESLDGEPIASPSAAGDTKETLLVRLAAASAVPLATGRQQIEELLDTKMAQPMLVLSRVPLEHTSRIGLAEQLPVHVTYLPISLDHLDTPALPS